MLISTSRSVDFHFVVHSDCVTHGRVGATHGEPIGEMTMTPNNLKESTTTNKPGHVDRSRSGPGSLTKPTT
jgi:hypothetical protein